ncbi:YraN family protein [Clostridium sp. SHJSY1]|uniref:YraN family protein n=1 Tax=Clostridium sp. SHJSY1 TaxID=2942483 RepID=UPI0028755EB7|nr:YraN family protein [Clostridium sp. SHJSY1]MDS0524906.1 YraN family protein [Clostridium sp. SHJSY1]
MIKNNKNIGNHGEDLALNFLKKKNHKILERNFRVSRGEIDIISQIDDILVFTEVKTRYNKNFGFAIESINSPKIRTIKLIASKYIHIKKLYDFNVRFDVIEIYLNYFDENFKLNYIENAF